MPTDDATHEFRNDTPTGRDSRRVGDRRRMKTWHETAEVAAGVRDALAHDAPVAVCTVVAIEGSAYRRPGAKLLVGPSVPNRGGVSGGCLEADAREVALKALETGHAHVRHYETGGDVDTVWGLGLGCNGSVDLLIQPILPDQAAVWSGLSTALGQHRSCAIVTICEGPTAGRTMLVVTDGPTAGRLGDDDGAAALERAARDALAEGRSRLVGEPGARAFIDVLRPPPVFLVIGAGDDAIPMARVSALAGFRVTVVDHRPTLLAPGRFPDGVGTVEARPTDELPGDLELRPEDLAVVMTHSYDTDLAWTRHLLHAGVSYLGVLGPRQRLDLMLEQIGGPVERLFGPVGLDIGADGAEQIAVSVVAEALAVRSGRTAGHLRDRRIPIHAYDLP